MYRKIILASASPRRRELLAQLGLEFTVEPAKGEENASGADPAEIVSSLARAKAAEIFEKHTEDVWVLGADTIVVHKGEILGKPKDFDDAVRMLRELSGDTHQVYTGAALFCRTEGMPSSRIFAECTDVTFYPMSDQEIVQYVKTGDPMDKAGAYGIQSGGMRFVRSISGDYNTVVGLPVARLYHEWQQFPDHPFR